MQHCYHTENNQNCYRIVYEQQKGSLIQQLISRKSITSNVTKLEFIASQLFINKIPFLAKLQQSWKSQKMHAPNRKTTNLIPFQLRSALEYLIPTPLYK